MTMAGMRQRPAFLLYRFLWNALDWVFPPNCAGCGVLGERWCISCRQSLTLLPSPLCSRCGVPVPGSTSTDLCQDCCAATPWFTSSRSVCVYTGAARKAIHRLKYGRDIGIGEALSFQMLELMHTLPWSVDIVTCVPLSKTRLRQRGYNQAAMLARPLALGLHVPFQPLLLRKDS